MDPSVEKKPDLKIDFREQRSGIAEELGKLPESLTFEITTLITGDYLIRDKIIIERKTLSDFLISIKNGRIFQQAYRMAKSGKNSLIILEGEKSTIDSNLMSRKTIQGALIHLNIFLGIPVIHAKNIQENASLIFTIFHQFEQEALPRQKQIISKCPGIRINKKQRQKLFLLQNLPGIGTKKALALLKSFSTLENIIHASPVDLTKVRGIGDKLADQIFTILHEPF